MNRTDATDIMNVIAREPEELRRLLKKRFIILGTQRIRHARESGHPVTRWFSWTPASAGVTCSARKLLFCLLFRVFQQPVRGLICAISDTSAAIGSQEIVEAEYIHSKHGDIKRHGWYVWGGHSFDIGSGFLRELQLLARYTQYDPDASTHNDRTDRLTMGTNLSVDRKYTKKQLNYELNSEQGVVADSNEFLVNVQVAF